MIWNEVAREAGSGLKLVQVPSFRRPTKRIDWVVLPKSFRKDVDAYLGWCACVDSFAANARSRPLAPNTLALRRNQIHAAVTALIETGVRPTVIRSLADLVPLENFKCILRRRDKMIGSRENIFNHDLAIALLDIARR
jgi:hypothetical protein